ncbi:KaiC domain protein, AF_0351 family [Halomicrobium zhouii]|uniref:KaiC domain protein, AF_0351 family n=1 Tax=Halomicrobium zhouii TaxID=767519 RepID=A0A1I6L8K5_9EURY|nr:KaiC domain-containing protein [Halomicrobium zhouii]SFR99821.1 KaiC domain protein, AF_0351 family [Halomicrobium zhouii]
MSEESSDDDWFERAVSGDDGDVDESEASGDSASEGTTAAGPSDRDLEDAAEDAFAAAQAHIESEGDQPSGATDDDPFDDGGSGGFDATNGAGGVDLGARDGGGSLFEDDFESAFRSAGGPGEDEFEDEDFESEIPRIDLGIAGLDAMIQGGVPARHLIVAIGSAGTGKTTFGLQFLHHGLEQGENAIFVTLEQSHGDIMATADEWDWEFEAYEEDGHLAVVDLDPVEMANSLDNIRGELPDLVEEFDADRLVLDSVSLLEMMYDDQARRRTEVFDFTRALKRAGVTTMLTSEASESNPYASRHGTIEYLTDAVFVLKYVRSENQETRLAVEIQKIRNANHSRETKPYEITTDGISVYQQASIF